MVEHANNLNSKLHWLTGRSCKDVRQWPRSDAVCCVDYADGYEVYHVYVVRFLQEISVKVGLH